MDLEQIKNKIKMKQAVLNSYVNQGDSIEDMKMMLEKLSEDFKNLADKITVE